MKTKTKRKLTALAALLSSGLAGCMAASPIEPWAHYPPPDETIREEPVIMMLVAPNRIGKVCAEVVNTAPIAMGCAVHGAGVIYVPHPGMLNLPTSQYMWAKLVQHEIGHALTDKPEGLRHFGEPVDYEANAKRINLLALELMQRAGKRMGAQIDREEYARLRAANAIKPDDG